MEKHYSKLLSETHRRVESTDLIESTIKEIQAILGFKKIIAFSGGGQLTKMKFEDQEIEKKIKEQSSQIKEKIVRDIMLRLRDYDVAVLTGGTNWDIPEIATRLARENNLPTIGVLPQRGQKDSLSKRNLLNIEIVVDPEYGDSQYGDESAIFAKLSDGMFVIGGGAGTLIEFSHAMKINEALKKYNQSIKKIVPINGVGGLSDSLHHIPGNDEIKQLALPKTTIFNGEDAFAWMKKELDLNDIFKETY